MKKISNMFMTCPPVNITTLIKEKKEFYSKIKTITITRTINLNKEEYEKFTNNFLDFYDNLKTPENTANRFFVVKIVCQSHPTIYVSTDGHSYPRYVGISD